MKCRSLRRRYVIFEVSGAADDSAISQAIGTLSTARSMTKLIARIDQYALIRVDHLSAGGLRGCQPIDLYPGNAKMRSIATTGTILGARKKIKKLRRTQ